MSFVYDGAIYEPHATERGNLWRYVCALFGHAWYVNHPRTVDCAWCDASAVRVL